MQAAWRKEMAGPRLLGCQGIRPLGLLAVLLGLVLPAGVFANAESDLIREILDQDPRYLPVEVPFPAGASYLDPAGAISIVGYNDMQGIIELWDKAFVKSHPKFKFALSLIGTKAGAPALTKGLSAFAPMGAEFYEADTAVYQKALGSLPLEFKVAHDSLDPKALSSPVAIIVNNSNSIEELTIDQVARIFSDGDPRGGLTAWEQLGGKDSQRGQPIHLYGLNFDTALGYYMQKHHFSGRPFRKNLVCASQSKLVSALVARDPLGIGFSVLNQIPAGVKVLRIVGGNGGAGMSGLETELLSGRYPYDRFLLIYVRQPMEPWIREYLHFIYSYEGQSALMQDPRRYLPLNRPEVAEQLARLEN